MGPIEHRVASVPATEAGARRFIFMGKGNISKCGSTGSRTREAWQAPWFSPLSPQRASCSPPLAQVNGSGQRGTWGPSRAPVSQTSVGLYYLTLHKPYSTRRQ